MNKPADKLQVRLHLLKEPLMGKFIFCLMCIPSPLTLHTDIVLVFMCLQSFMRLPRVSLVFICFKYCFN